MKALFFTADLGGNVPPVLAVAQELAGRGWDIEVAGLAAGESAFAQPRFPAGIAAGPVSGMGITRIASIAGITASRNARNDAAVIIASSQPDVVAVDCLLLTPLRAALASGIPVAVLAHTVGAYWSRLYHPFTATSLDLFGVSLSMYWDQAAVRLMLTDAELDPGSRDPVLSHWTWTGSTEQASPPSPRPPGHRPRVLVSLSTTDWPGMRPIYRRVIEALSHLPVDAVVTTGDAAFTDALGGADNVEVRGWVDHAALLPEMDLLIGHGGHSTTLKALAHGIPVLVLPVNPVSDEAGIGDVLRARRLGMRVRPSARPRGLAAAITSLLTDSAVRENAASHGRRLRGLRPGAAVAADHITRVAAR
ncbi:glycosyltransferase [Brevibacterium luteolum]|uniref:Erythromycin biosynthesis protein CIII-like C-terminal domain-containing protein n=1 Tax=Brevibacterium luteolum TaxID=199591 RepID=A0A6G8KUQ8_9MICO|nr:nucleotide disphospho-sugar-binding domain-containing protein [Brevibacterium luteolum]QIN28529.1 hypothetical protein EW640_03970 [Brevibacterium luteolum]